MNNKLTQRQQEVYELISQNIREKGTPPTRSEIADLMGFKSANAAEDHLKALARKGLLQLIPGTSRGIRLLDNHAGLPVISMNSAFPLISESNILNRITIDNKIFVPSADLIVIAKDDSMSGFGIFERDLVCIHQTKEVYSGQTCLINYNGELIVRKMRLNVDTMVLLPANNIFPNIIVNKTTDKIAIEGICVGVIRSNIK